MEDDFDLEDDFQPRGCNCDSSGQHWTFHSDDCPFFVDSEEYYREDFD